MKDETGHLQSTPKSKSLAAVFFLLILFLPTQLGKHFWPDFSFVLGQRVDYLSPTLYFTDILSILFILMWVFEKKKTFRVSDFKFLKKLIIPSFFLLFLSVGIFFSKNPLTGWYHLLKLSEFILLGFALKEFLNIGKNKQFLFYPLVIGVFFESILGIWQFVRQSSIGGLLYYVGERTFNGETPGIANTSLNGQLILRPYATFSHPNVLAAYLAVAMIIIASRNQVLSKTKGIIIVLAIAIGTLALVLSLSRIAILLWIIVLVFKLTTVIKKIFPVKIKKVHYFLIPGCFLLIVLGVFFLTPLHYRFFLSLDNESVGDRLYLIRAASLMITRYPLFGVGFGNFFTELPLAIPDHHVGSVILLQPVHNFFFLITAETGIPGLLFALWFFYKTIERNLSLQFKETILSDNLVLFSAVIILGMFDHYFLTIQQGQMLLTLILAICWSKLRT